MLERILALDLGTCNTAAHLHCSDGRRDFRTRVKTTKQALHDLIVSTDPTLVIIETCSLTWWVYDLVVALDKEVIITANNGPGWRWKNVRNKSDRTDAAKLIKMYLSDQLEPVWAPPAAIREMRALLRYRKTLKEDRNGLGSRIRSFFTLNGIELPKGTWTQTWLKAVRGHAKPLCECAPDELWRGCLAHLLVQWKVIQEQLDETEDVLARIARNQKGVELLRREKGVGPCLSQAVVAAIGDPLRFKSGKQVGCYAGLTPRQWSSGTMERSGHISKQGNGLLRTVLVEVSWIGIRTQPWMREVFERVQRGVKQRSKIAIVAVARRLLIHLWAKWRDMERARLAATPPAPELALNGMT